MLKVIDSTDRIIKMLIRIGNLKRIVAFDMSGGSELGHSRRGNDLARASIRAFQLIKYQKMVPYDIIGYLLGGKSRPFG